RESFCKGVSLVGCCPERRAFFVPPAQLRRRASPSLPTVLQEGLFYVLVGLAGPSAPALHTGTYPRRRSEHSWRNGSALDPGADFPLHVRHGARAIVMGAWMRAPSR